MNVRQLDGRATGAVADLGSGIPVPLLPRLFARRAPPGQEKHRPGTCVCKTMVALHSGGNRAEGQEVQGTAFPIELPRWAWSGFGGRV